MDGDCRDYILDNNDTRVSTWKFPTIVEHIRYGLIINKLHRIVSRCQVLEYDTQILQRPTERRKRIRTQMHANQLKSNPNGRIWHDSLQMIPEDRTQTTEIIGLLPRFHLICFIPDEIELPNFFFF